MARFDLRVIVGQQALMRPARKAKVVVESHFVRGVQNTMVLVVVDPLFLLYSWVALEPGAYSCAGPQLSGLHMAWVVLSALVHLGLRGTLSHYLLGWILVGSFVHSVSRCCYWMMVVEANHQPSSAMG